MGDIVSLESAQQQRLDRVQKLWAAYTAAREEAERTKDINDGIRAGKAWAAWLDHFRVVSA